MTDIAIDAAPFNQHDEIAALLTAADLPVPDAADAPVSMLSAVVDGRAIGCAGWERYEDAALLRSVAVHSDWRGRDVGRRLVEGACARLRDSGVRDVFLLTKGAEGFFAGQGFAAIDRGEVPAALQASSSFQGECCAHASAMCRRL